MNLRDWLGSDGRLTLSGDGGFTGTDDSKPLDMATDRNLDILCVLNAWNATRIKEVVAGSMSRSE